jgi:hypothetical protein
MPVMTVQLTTSAQSFALGMWTTDGYVIAETIPCGYSSEEVY